MDTSIMGMQIPSLANIVTFLIFQFWPIELAILGIILAALHQSEKSQKGILSLLFNIPLVLFLSSAITGIANSPPKVGHFIQISQYFIQSLVVITLVSLINILPLLTFIFLWKKRHVFAIVFSGIFVGAFIFFYPKPQVTVLVHNTNNRHVPAQECTCIGISELAISSEYFLGSSECFGIPLFCKKTSIDRCPTENEGTECMIML